MIHNQIKEVTPTQAWEMLQADPNAVLLDVRSSMEFQYVGHPINAVHIPLMEPPAWRVDPDFVNKVRTALSQSPADTGVENLPLLAICRSGHRSHNAAALLATAGFKHLYNVLEGFEGDLDGEKHRGTLNGWRFHGLPWEQS